MGLGGPRGREIGMELSYGGERGLIRGRRGRDGARLVVRRRGRHDGGRMARVLVPRDGQVPIRVHGEGLARRGGVER